MKFYYGSPAAGHNVMSPHHTHVKALGSPAMRIDRVPRLGAAQDYADEVPDNTPPRKPLNDMTRDEKLRELLVDPVTHIPNRRAWNEMGKGLAQAWIDADGPESLADAKGRAVCNWHLQAIAAALQEAMPNRVAYFYGDIFAAHAQTSLGLERGILSASSILSRARTSMTRPDGKTAVFHGLGFSNGQGSDLQAAEAALAGAKRGAQSKGFVLPAGARLPDRLKPLLKLGYEVTQVCLFMPNGSVKEFNCQTPV
jgi:hypothetical protein